MKSTIAKATLLCGTLDILYAIIMSVIHGGSALQVLLAVASGPFGGEAKSWGWLGGIVGLAVHFAIMSIMVTTYVILNKRIPVLASMNSLLSGAIYGCLLYLVMYWIVLVLRWPNIFPQTDPIQIVRALIPHIFLVGIPLALIVKRSLKTDKS